MDLVVMAAGMGSRFGGLKQCEPIDNDKNFILDYSIHDAVKAGFDRIVLIIKEENYEYFKATVGRRLESVVPVVYVFQKLDNVPENFTVPAERVKPWGTAHALYCCKDVVAEKFAVINADDFYGYQSYEIVANFLRQSTSHKEFVSAGFYADNTLSDKGAVKRGILTIKDGFATDLVESEIEKRGDKTFATPLGENNWREIDGNTPVSMNMFGFTRKLMDIISREMVAFFNRPIEKVIKDEFLLPQVLNDVMRTKEVDLVVEKTPAKWYGITYREDLEEFKQAIINMKANGEYPEHLYEDLKN